MRQKAAWCGSPTECAQIGIAVRTAACFAEDPLTQQWKAVTRILEYLKGIGDLGMNLVGHGRDILTAFSDSIYSNDK